MKRSEFFKALLDCGQWPEPSSKLSHSVEKLVTPFTSLDQEIRGPLFTPRGSLRIVNEVLSRVLGELSVGDAKLPIATVRDDMVQLSWNRVSRATGDAAPLCYFSQGGHFVCAALDYMHSHGALHAHLTPAEERRFQEEGAKNLPKDRPCLLCERRDLASLIDMHGSSVDPTRQVGAPIIWPLCQPIVSSAGGYTREACYPVTCVVPVPIVRADIPLVVRSDMGSPYFDQGASVFGLAPLN